MAKSVKTEHLLKGNCLKRLLKVSKLQMYILELEANYVRVCALKHARGTPPL